MMIWLNSNADLSLLALGFFFFFFYIPRWYIETAAAYGVVVVAVVVVGLVAKQREGFTSISQLFFFFFSVLCLRFARENEHKQEDVDNLETNQFKTKKVEKRRWPWSMAI